MSSKASNIVKEQKKLNSSAICWLRKVTKLRRLTRSVSKKQGCYCVQKVVGLCENEAFMEAVMINIRWLIACDANVEPQTFANRTWFKESFAVVRSTVSEQLYVQVESARTSQSETDVRLRGGITLWKTFDSRPHKPMQFMIKREKDVKIVRVPRTRRQLPVHSKQRAHQDR